MKMNASFKRLLWPLAGIALAACGLLRQREYLPSPDPNHAHADFALWIEGRRWDFAQEQYMSSEEPGDEEHEKHGHRHDYLHLHDGVGHVVHRHKPGFGFGDFLESLAFAFEGNCFVTDTRERFCDEGEKRWRMFVNGEEMPVTPGYVFEDLDRILLTYGANDEDAQEQLAKLTDDACSYSKRCPWKGEAPVENCIADPTVPCVAPPEE